MFNAFEKIRSLTGQLFPTGRAHAIPKDGPKDRLFKGLARSEARAYNDAVSILSAILPDNDNFTADDASAWEYRLGLIDGTGTTSLPDRKAALIRKMNHPGDLKARQSWDYLQQSLQLAGFDVYVYENLTNISPSSALLLPPSIGQLGPNQLANLQAGNVFSNFAALFSTVQLGQTQLGGGTQLAGKIFKNIIANHIDETLDYGFNVGSDYKSTFFIGGPVLGTLATVPLGRKEEFRQIILRIKPVQSIGYLFINYV